MVRNNLPGADGATGGEDRPDPEGPRWESIVERELEVVEKRLSQLEGIATDRAAQIVLIEAGHMYFIRAVLKGLVRSAYGRSRDTRAMNQFQKALIEAGRLADPVKKVLAQLGVDSVEEAERIVVAYRNAQRSTQEDRLQIALKTVDEHLKTTPEDREGIVRRFGGVLEGLSDGDS